MSFRANSMSQKELQRRLIMHHDVATRWFDRSCLSLEVLGMERNVLVHERRDEVFHHSEREDVVSPQRFTTSPPRPIPIRPARASSTVPNRLNAVTMERLTHSTSGRTPPGS